MSSKPKGLMALDGPALAKLVDDTVVALRVRNPSWLKLYGDSLPARVQELLLEGEAVARKTGLYSTGGVKVEYDAEGESTEVWVLIRTVYDDLEGGDDAD